MGNGEPKLEGLVRKGEHGHPRQHDDLLSGLSSVGLMLLPGVQDRAVSHRTFELCVIAIKPCSIAGRRRQPFVRSCDQYSEAAHSVA
jgi:hypothetical protein